MASFSFNDWQAQSSAAKSKNSGTKVGFFKLAHSEDEALVRFNVSSPDSLAFATVHKVKRNPTDSFCGMSVSCINPFGQRADECPLCTAVDNGDERVTKATKRVFVQMLVSYKDSTTGTWSQPAPVIWERSASQKAGFVSDLVGKLRDYGDLRNQLFKVTKHGEKLDTQYSIDYAVPAIFKPEMIPADFSAFDNFNIAKHSYWEKTAEECKVYLETGSFPEVVRADSDVTAPAVNTVASAPTTSAATANVTNTPAAPAVDTPAAPAATKTFGHYSF